MTWGLHPLNILTFASFYFVSQVSENGGPVAYEKVDGEAHAQKYLELINQKDQGDWDVRFQS